MLLQKDMFRAHQYSTGWAVETDEVYEVGDGDGDDDTAER